MTIPPVRIFASQFAFPFHTAPPRTWEKSVVWINGETRNCGRSSGNCCWTTKTDVEVARSAPSLIEVGPTRARRAAWLIVVCGLLVLGGCVPPIPVVLTYPAPRPSEGDHAAIPVYGKTARYSFEEACVALGGISPAGPTRVAMVVLSQGVRLCFASPDVGGDRHFCMGKRPFGQAPQGPVSFRVFVKDEDATLSNPRATLDVNGRSATVDASITRFDHYGPISEMQFAFPQPCDIRARYRLTVTGVMQGDRQVQIPSIDFEPADEPTIVFVGE
jgi:hypothetical protein